MTMPSDYYGTDPASWRLTVLHRVIKEMTGRQNRVAWLSHRAERIRVLKAERRRRMAAIAAVWAAGGGAQAFRILTAAIDEQEREVRARRAKREHGR